MKNFFFINDMISNFQLLSAIFIAKTVQKQFQPFIFGKFKK